MSTSYLLLVNPICSTLGDEPVLQEMPKGGNVLFSMSHGSPRLLVRSLRIQRQLVPISVRLITPMGNVGTHTARYGTHSRVDLRNRRAGFDGQLIYRTKHGSTVQADRTISFGRVIFRQ